MKPTPDPAGTRPSSFGDELPDEPYDPEEDEVRLVAWPQRAADVAAVPIDATRGLARFAELWASEQHLVEVDADELGRIGAYLQFVQVAKGREVIAQDEQGDYLIVMLEGRVAVERGHPTGKRVRLAEARAGDMLGEMSLLDAGARFSACVTLTPCELAVLDADDLRRLIHDEPRLALSLMAALSRRLSLRLRRVSARLGALLAHG